MQTLLKSGAVAMLVVAASQALAQTDEDAAAAAAEPGEGDAAAAAAAAPGGAEAQAGAGAQAAGTAVEGELSQEAQAAIEEAIAVRDVLALYAAWSGPDEILTVDEWDTVVDRLFGEEDVNLAVAQWDDDSNGVISPVEFEEAVAKDDLFDTVLR